MRHGNTLACYPGVPAPYFGTHERGQMSLVELQPGAGAHAVAHALDTRRAQDAAKKRSTLSAKGSG